MTSLARKPYHQTDFPSGTLIPAGSTFNSIFPVDVSVEAIAKTVNFRIPEAIKFANIFAQTTEHLESLRPGIKIGSTFGRFALLGASLEEELEYLSATSSLPSNPGGSPNLAFVEIDRASHVTGFELVALDGTNPDSSVIQLAGAYDEGDVNDEFMGEYNLIRYPKNNASEILQDEMIDELRAKQIAAGIAQRVGAVISVEASVQEQVQAIYAEAPNRQHITEFAYKSTDGVRVEAHTSTLTRPKKLDVLRAVSIYQELPRQSHDVPTQIATFDIQSNTTGNKKPRHSAALSMLIVNGDRPMGPDERAALYEEFLEIFKSNPMLFFGAIATALENLPLA